jgi:hypothetical protein
MSMVLTDPKPRICDYHVRATPATFRTERRAYACRAFVEMGRSGFPMAIGRCRADEETQT